nr:hypothetical protein [Tanacetum cinerariifolium]
MKRQGKDFSGRVTPLFPTMIVQAQQETSVPREVVADEAVYEEMSERVSKFSNDPPLSRVNTLGRWDDRLKLADLMELCNQLQSRVLALETTKTNQALEIGSLKRRVKKPKKKTSKRTHKLSRLYKIGSSRIIKSTNEASLDDQEDASKQGRIIDNLDADKRVTLVDETQRRNDQDMFDIGVLNDEEVVTEKEVSTADPVTTTGEVVTTADVEVSVTDATPTICNTLILTNIAMKANLGYYFIVQQS